MKLTPYHAKFLAHELTRRCPANELGKLSSTLSNAQVDLNPHQIEAALFAFRSPLSKGAILADEVGLGKTIEAGLVLAQKWAERKRKILLVVPSSLRKQWSAELQEKFFLPSIILEKKTFGEEIKKGNLNPFIQSDRVVICSYQFARLKAPYLKQVSWDLVVVDEAHRLRNVYKKGNKIAREIKEALDGSPKILLTATPLQNSLLELYGLVSFVDEHVFGDLKTFKNDYARVSREQDINENELGLVVPRVEKFNELRERLKQICKRTLRRQVLEYIKYTKRIPLTQEYTATTQEVELYDGMSDYLRQPKLYALPSSQRQLMTLILRKLLASSSFAIASTLNGLVFKLEELIKLAKSQQGQVSEIPVELEENFELLGEMKEEWVDNEEADEEESEKPAERFTEKDIEMMEKEQQQLKKFWNLARGIFTNSKGEALLIALKRGFEQAAMYGAQTPKAIIFTESTITQKYLLDLLTEEGYGGKIVLFNGTNNDPLSKQIYADWLSIHKDSDRVSGSKSADLRAALVDHFKNTAEIMIATEAAAEGVNLQFCSLVINYDLPWNPQRIEQRIGRCHRYGQKYDVVVINFVNLKNAADKRVHELLDQKFNLFKGVFGASDEVLGSIESGVDFEKRIARIYQDCRTETEINTAFDALQVEMDEGIQEGLKDARAKLLENFDEEVHEKLKINLRESKVNLDTFQKNLWNVTRYFLGKDAEFSEDEFAFSLHKNPFPEEGHIDPGPYRIGKNIEDVHVYRVGHPLAERILTVLKGKELKPGSVVFNYSGNESHVSVLEPLLGKSGYVRVSNFTVQAFEKEDYLIVSGLQSDGTPIEPEVMQKIFKLSGEFSEGRETVADIPTDLLEKIEAENIKQVSGGVAERNHAFFDDEVEKLDKWAEDVKQALELDIKKLDIDIKVAKTNAKKILELKDKVAAQKTIKEMEVKRNAMRKQLFDAQDKVEKDKEALIGQVEEQMKQKAGTEHLFTIQWSII